jgi:hypothetical protein
MLTYKTEIKRLYYPEIILCKFGFFYQDLAPNELRKVLN